MSRYFETFPSTALFPVVHVTSSEAQTSENIDVALECGADGVFLIHHRYDTPSLLQVYSRTRSNHPKAWIGLNFLGETPLAALRLAPPCANGLWLDSIGITDTVVPTRAIDFSLAHADAVRQGKALLTFVGIAFKYRTEVHNPRQAAANAVSYVDVVTTSGPGTGYAPKLDKIRSMRKGCGTHPLAIASGITPGNVGDFLPQINAILVYSGISNPENGDIIPTALQLLREKIDEYKRVRNT